MRCSRLSEGGSVGNRSQGLFHLLHLPPYPLERSPPSFTVAHRCFSPNCAPNATEKQKFIFSMRLGCVILTRGQLRPVGTRAMNTRSEKVRPVELTLPEECPVSVTGKRLNYTEFRRLRTNERSRPYDAIYQIYVRLEKSPTSDNAGDSYSAFIIS